MLRIIILLLFFSTNSLANCSFSGMDFWPKGKTIFQDPIILINGYSFSQKIILSLNVQYPVYLKSGYIRVQLIVKEILVGEAGLTQAILIPAGELISGLEYQLQIDSSSENNDFETKFLNEDIRKYQFPIWKVKKGNDLEKPVWMIKPAVIKKIITFPQSP